MVGRDAAESIKIITREASERIARFAFEYAVANGRHKVTAVHKANIMKLSDGLFLESCRTVAAELRGPDRVRGPHRRQHVHAARPEARAVRRARRCRTSTATSSATSRPGSSAGWAWRRARTSGTEAAVFEPVHGSAPKYAGLNKANPTALILSGALMLRHLGYPRRAERVEAAVRDVIAEGRATTYDLGGDAGTQPVRRRDHRAPGRHAGRGRRTTASAISDTRPEDTKLDDHASDAGPAADQAPPPSRPGPRPRGFGATSRKDAWWLAPAVQGTLFTVCATYLFVSGILL